MPDADEHIVEPRKQQYLVGKKKSATRGAGESDVNSSSTGPDALVVLREAFRADPEITLVDTLGSPDQPEVLVAVIDPERAEQLKSQYPQLIIEEDNPLNTLNPLEPC